MPALENRTKRPARSRMTAAERREQLIEIARTVFSEKGFDGVSVEEIAARAQVSKPVVYEHFGGKEGLYAVVVDREVRQLLTMMREALTSGSPRLLLEQAAFALLGYIEESSGGFRILVRDSPLGSASGSYVSIMSDIATRVGMVGTTGQWWLDARKPAKEVVAANLVNLAWNGLAGLEVKPELRQQR
jgi:AcrR family transcriptional regulator